MKRSNTIPQRTKDLLPTYFACLDHESAAAGSHQNTLLSLELGLLGIQYLSREDMSSFWMLAIAGIVLCFLIGPLYEYRVNNVDYWRDQILAEIHGTSLAKTFRDGGYGSSVFGKKWKKLRSIIRHWFTALFIPIVLLGWFAALAFNPPNLQMYRQIDTYHWFFWFTCEALWIGILKFLRTRQGKKARA